MCRSPLSPEFARRCGVFPVYRRNKKVTRRSCPLQCNEQDIVDGLHPSSVIGNADHRRRTSKSSSVLYRVIIQGQGTPRTMVVKKFQHNETGPDVESRCLAEVNLLGSMCHHSIINLAGHIRTDSCVLLVYDHMENGSLHKWLHPSLPQVPAEGEETVRLRPLDWPTRRAIAVDVASGICHLHHGCNNLIVHHNINSNSILLDGDLKAKIAGFGYAQLNLAGLDHPVPAWELTGTNIFGYTAPEYTTEVTQKVDVYGFGVVLLELVTGRVANQAAVDGHLATWAGKHCNQLLKNNAAGFNNDAADHNIPDRARHLKEMAAMFRLGVSCTVREASERPSIKTVLQHLRGHGRF
ncbi:probable inactive receptor kinase At1g27190 [Lolium rigidum]|uniref:probable inactive receptor kinase At1g27190 n=1 Tax=Lolium rigidum TaxID=89674 RepID=UPI001F5E00CA|nr:probable inactive receptor kinase At1g27190 [Lolium rigidum]